MVCLIGFLAVGSLCAQARLVLDLADSSPARQRLTRIHGAMGQGNFGVPVSPPADADGDGLPDVAVAFLRASPAGRANAGEVDLVLGSGRLGETIDTARDQPRLLRVFGDGNLESAGNEIWLDDVTGDGVADLLIGRQNFTPSPDRIGAGALTIVTGGAALRALAAASRPLDLRAPDPSVAVFTIVGRRALDRMGIWMRTGDVDGDGVADVVVGADQEDARAECGSGEGCFNQGATYVIRGGAHLAASRTVGLDAVAGSPLDDHLARLAPPAGSLNYHLGATCFIADLDGNGRGEVLTGAALNRAGASINPAGAPGTAFARGGAPGGELFIAWDDLFAAGPWPAGFELDLSALGPSGTRLRGGAGNGIFGEEILGGSDLDGDGRADLFVGDFEADDSPGANRPLSGTGYVFYAAGELKGTDFALPALPEGMRLTRIAGPSAFAIGADTAALGDFNGDGIGDLAYGSPHHDPLGRVTAGSIHVLLGRVGGWPELVSTAPGEIPAPEAVEVIEIFGARGTEAGDRGDTLCYSAAAGDADGDGVDDLLTNEMLGNGLAAGTLDVGNLIVLAGQEVSRTYRLLFAQVGAGQGLVSELVLTNPSPDVPVAGSVRVTGAGGEPLPILEDGAPAPAGLAQIVRFEIPPLGSFRVRTREQGELAAGAATVVSNSRLGGVVRFEIPGLGVTGVPASEGLRGFVTPVRTLPPRTGLAYFNPTEAEVVLTFSLREESGAPGPLPDVTEVLPPGGHASLFLTDLFEGLAGSDFQGNLVAAADGGEVAAVALDLGSRAGQLVALPVTPLAQREP